MKALFRSLSLWVCCLGLLAATGITVFARAEDKPKPAAPETGIDFLNVGDKIRVVFTDIPNPPVPVELQIPENGEITLHYGHKFLFKGKRRNALEAEIAQYYKDKGLYRIINVTIEVLPRPFTVGGEVRNPNQYPHQGQLTILKAIDTAGGFTEFANRRSVKIIRGGKTITVNCNKAEKDPAKYDVPVYAGDTIKVSRGIF